jgi:hypothetical protein
MKESCSGLARLTPKDVHHNLSTILNNILGKKGLGGISLLEPYKSNEDDTTKFLVTNGARQPALVVIFSSSVAPESVTRNIESAALAASILGGNLAHPILQPLSQGRLEGLSYAVWEYCTPLSRHPIISRIQEMMIRNAVFNWLRRVTIATVQPVCSAELESSVLVPLQSLVSNPKLSAAMHEAAKRSIRRAICGEWEPVHILMHNDFWRGNLLVRSWRLGQPIRWSDRFVVIDWAGCLHKGYGIYDLLRMAGSLRLNNSVLKEELCAHCHALGCDPVDAESHLLTALGWLGLHLEHFPRDRYVRLALNCFEQLENLGNSSKAKSEGP